MNTKSDMVIQQLKKLQEKISSLKEKHVHHYDTPEFRTWHKDLVKWLKLGLPYTQTELDEIQHRSYVVLRIGRGGYGHDDEKVYQSRLDITHHQIESAIENIEYGLVPDKTETPDEPKRKPKREESRSVSVSEAGTVIIGDSNVISIVDTITVADFLSSIEKEIETNVEDKEERRGLLQKIKDLSSHPIVSTVVSQKLGDVLRNYFGG